ncbi:MAG: PfkB family carbohydrate kinase [Ornithinimicrobium sp.]|uniref:PfkB family carbohydrate kinase n=1 Tax=Ornithinimicrobium sp. TaxID=1977084 RepID=UPI0026E10919|nr:PfkB family carbohydrate kinase [Ornithinimicrobium sp.]MDO5738784.1 PfkB family carbohydrate kinase [Ornithinimicrobium sp.]
MGNGAPRIVAIGDNVVDCYVDLGWMYPGGNAVNVAVHAARLGMHTAYIGAVGTDEAGACVRNALRDEGVDILRTRVIEGPNARAVVHVVDGNRVFGDGSVGVSRFVPAPADLELIAGADLVHTGDCSMMEEHLGTLREHAQWLSFDFSEQPWDYIAEHAPLVDIALCSLPSGDSVEHRARAVAGLGPQIVVVTQGPSGASLLTKEGLHHSPAGLGQIVDTLGAGDAAAARFLTGLINGESAASALDAATAYATTACTEYGAFGHRTPLTSAIEVRPTKETV